MPVERARLERRNTLVNASLGSLAMFAVVSCGGSESEPEGETSAISAPDGITDLNAIWSSRTLDGTPAALSIAEGDVPRAAIAFEEGGLQLYNFDGERVGDLAPIDVEMLARGRTATVSDTPLTLFPAVVPGGSFSIIVTGAGLPSPLPVEVDLDVATGLVGLCSGDAGGAADSVMSLAYWTFATPATLVYGDLTVTNSDQFRWEPRGSITVDEERIADCAFSGSEPIIAAGPKVMPLSQWELIDEERDAIYMAQARILGIDTLENDDRSFTIAHTELGEVLLYKPDGRVDALLFRDGLSVSVPEDIAFLAGLGTARNGGFTDGLIALTGAVAEGDQRLTLIDTGPLFEN